MQFAGFSKAFMTDKRPAGRLSLRFSLYVAETATRCQNCPGVFPGDRQRLRHNPVRQLHFTARPGQGRGESSAARRMTVNPGRKSPPASIAGFQNAATLL
jgi:hypothetical protein